MVHWGRRRAFTSQPRGLCQSRDCPPTDLIGSREFLDGLAGCQPAPDLIVLESRSSRFAAKLRTCAAWRPQLARPTILWFSSSAMADRSAISPDRSVSSDRGQGALRIDAFDQSQAVEHRAGGAVPRCDTRMWPVPNASTAFSNSGRPLVELLPGLPAISQCACAVASSTAASHVLGRRTARPALSAQIAPRYLQRQCHKRQRQKFQLNLFSLGQTFHSRNQLASTICTPVTSMTASLSLSPSV